MENTNKNSKSSSDPYKITLPKFDANAFLAGSKGKIGSNPKAILEEIGLKEGEAVADFGSGVGFFVIEAAQAVGPRGKVVAIDINQSLLEALKTKAVNSGMRNIYGVLADLEKPGATKLEDSSMDLVLMINFLYLINNKEAVLQEAYRILKPGGKLAVMDWSEKGPHAMIEKEENVHKELKELTKKIGFKKLKTFEAGLSHETNVFMK